MSKIIFPFSIFVKIFLDDECVEIPEEDIYYGDDSIIYYDENGEQHSVAIDEIDP